MSNSAKISSATTIGLALSLLGYLIISVTLQIPSIKNTLLPNPTAVLGFLFAWVLTGALILIVILGERRSLESIGIKIITIKDVLFAVALGILLSLSVPVLTLIASHIIPSSPLGNISSVTESVSVVIIFLGVLTAGITEEILFRAYPIERIIELTGNKWLALAISVIAFVLPHMAGWNLTHIIGVVLPLSLILSGIYIWKRNIIFNMIIHILVNLPLVFLALSSNQN